LGGEETGNNVERQVGSISKRLEEKIVGETGLMRRDLKRRNVDSGVCSRLQHAMQNSRDPTAVCGHVSPKRDGYKNSGLGGREKGELIFLFPRRAGWIL